MRLFIALNFDEKVKLEFVELQNRLRGHIKRGRFTLPENLHLTLAFLGETDSVREENVLRAMERTSVEQMELVFNQVGSFKRDGGDIWWVAPREDKELLRMQRELVERLREEGFRLENRKYTPHLTLSRDVKLSEPAAGAALLGKPIHAVADKISLMLSERVNGKLRYSELATR